MIQASAENCNRIDFYRTFVIVVVRDQPVYYNSNSCIVKTCFQPTAWACKCVCASWVQNDGISTDGRFLLCVKQKPWIFLLGVAPKEISWDIKDLCMEGVDMRYVLLISYKSIASAVIPERQAVIASYTHHN